MIHSSMIIFKFIKTKSQIIVSSLNAKNVHQSPKRHSKLLSLIFTLNCLSKTSVIRIFGIRTKNMKFDQHYERGLLSYYPHHHHYLGIISPSPDEWQKKPKYILMEKYYGIKIDNQKNWCQICNKLPDTQVKSWGGGWSHLCTLLLNWRSYQCLEWRIFAKSQQFQYCFVSMLNAISVSYWAAWRKIDKVIEAKVNDQVL